MKLYIPLLAVSALVFASCSTAYKTGQTPDDVYYSPARASDEYVVAEKEDDRSYHGEDYYEDRYLRNRISNRYRWSALDDYYNNPYAYNSYGYYNSWNSPWNNYWTWNHYYNPYCGYGSGYGGGIIIKNPGNYRPPSRALAFNPASYNNSNTRNLNARSYGSPGYNPNNSARYNNSNAPRNSGSLGNSVRRVFSSGSGSSNNSNNSSRSDNNTPSRSYNPPSSSSSSSSGSSGRSSSGSSSGGGSRPVR